MSIFSHCHDNPSTCRPRDPVVRLAGSSDSRGARVWVWLVCGATALVPLAQGQEEFPYPCELQRELVPWQATLTAQYQWAGDQFGRRVAVDAETLVVGAHGADDRAQDAGAAYVFIREGGSWVQQAKLVGADTVAGDAFGVAVAVDGDTVVVGAHGNDERGENAGAAYVYVLQGNSWIQQAKLTAQDAAPADYFGYAVGISGDTIVVGAYGVDDRGVNAGAAYVFAREGGSWVQQAKIFGADTAAGDFFGVAVAVDGESAVVGAHRHRVGTTTEAGAAYVFVRETEGTSWVQQAKLSASDRFQYDHFGGSVAIDGSTIVSGATGKDIDPARNNTWDAGTVYVFVRSGTSWAQQARLNASDRAGGDEFGVGVAVSGDSVAVGSYGDDDRGANSGSTYVYVRQGTAWTQRAKLIAADGAANDRFGVAVSLSGTTLVVGAHLDDDRGQDSGSAYVYGGQGTSWTLQTKVTASDSADNDQLGASVAWSGDTIALGAPFDRDAGAGYGSVYLFAEQEGDWNQQAKLTAPEGLDQSTFGQALALEGDTLAVGATAPPPAAGTVFLFERQDAGWRAQAKLTTPDPTAEDGFGNAVALRGETLVVGAAHGDGREPGAGAAYVFVREDGAWVEQAKLSASDGVEGDQFGSAMAVDGDTVVIGAPVGGSHPSPSGMYGAAYVFVRQGTEWIEQAKLIASDHTASDLLGTYFGECLALDGDTLVVGARLQGDLHGAAFVFVRQGSEWIEQAKLAASDGAANDQFGQSLALSGDTLLVGASNDQGADFSGSVYLFFRDGSRWFEQGKLTSCVGFDSNLNRAALALNGTRILVGAREEGAIAPQSGAAYVLSLEHSDTAVAGYARKLLYYDAAEPDPDSPFSRDLAAFRYRQRLYGFGTDGIRARFDTMQDLYGPADEARAQAAENIAKRGLQFYADSPALRALLLDIYYDRAVAEGILAKGRLAEADGVRLGIVSPSLGFVIDDEIALHREALAAQGVALGGHFALLSADLGRTDAPPLGYQIFQQDVPGRVLAPATCLVTNEQTAEVTVEPVTADPSPLLGGYKDLVLIYQLLGDYGRTAAALARLHAGRDGAGDLAAVQELIRDTQRFLLIRMNLLRGVFPAMAPTERGGQAEAVAGVNDSLAQLENLKQTLRGQVNLLGFDRDFLFFVSRFTGALTNYYDSYDAFRERLVVPTGPLRLAQAALDTAKGAYDTTRIGEDDLAQQLADSCITYRDRLRDIVGVFPDHPNYGDDPTLNPGSELDQQYRGIEAARLRILRNRTEISNLDQRIEIERRRGGDVAGTYIKYGNRRADLVQEINHLKAAQAAVDSLLGNLSFEPKQLAASLVTGAVNAAVQGATQASIGAKEAELERLGGLEKADVEGINSAAQVKTWLLEMNTLVIDSQEAALLLKQEVHRLQGLYREKADLERKLAEMDTRLSRRYFADPVHRLRYTVGTQRAHLAFEQAQKWLFFTARALEYKWNRPFVLPASQSPDGRDWRLEHVFKLRNADELWDMYVALDTFDALYSGPSTSDDRFDWFSVREHFLGYLREDAHGVPQVYVDPASGETVDALEAFRRHLRRLVEEGWIELGFSTVREIENRSFFRGPTYRSDGTLDSTKKGSYLDKIRWIKIRLPGDYAQQPVSGYLTYGGVSYLRNPSVGTRDPDRPDRIANEMTPYNTRYWYYQDGTWRSNEGLTAEVSMLKVPRTDPRLDGNPNQPDVLPSVNQIDVFKERAVAATGWHLAIPVTGAGGVPIDKLDDIEIYFYHWAFNRQ